MNPSNPSLMKRKTNFDRYLEEQLKDVVFAERFKKAGEAWASPKVIPLRKDEMNSDDFLSSGKTDKDGHWEVIEKSEG